MAGDEQELTGGNASGSVVRVGHTVRKPWLENSAAIMGDRWVFIDWDGAGPSTRLWDLAYAAQSFGLLFEGQPVDDAAVRLRAVVDGYEADGAMRQALPAAMADRTAAMFNLLKSSNETGFQPWADMYVNGHGEHWGSAAEYVARNQTAWERALA